MRKLSFLLSLALSASARAGTTTEAPGVPSAGIPSTRAINTTAPLTGGGNLSADRTIAIPKADGTHNGYLGTTDWTTFNAKQAAGNYITALTGDVTASGAGSVAATLATVTTAKGGTNKVSWSATSIPYLASTTAFGEDANLTWDATHHRLGVGPNPPNYQVSIDGGDLDAGSGNGVLEIKSNPTNYGPELRMQNAASGHTYLFVNGGAGDTVGITNFGIQDGGTVRLLILGTGEVGIGASLTPAAKLDVQGTTKLGTAGVAFTAAGGCTVASTTLSTTATDLTCTGVPASAAVAVNCSGQAAFTTPTAGGLYCRAKGTADTITCNTVVANAVAMAYSCSWIQP